MSNPFADKESLSRKEKFVKAYEELVNQYQIELMAFPQLVPSGQNGFNMSATLVPIDRKEMSVPSPLQGKNGEIIK